MVQTKCLLLQLSNQVDVEVYPGIRALAPPALPTRRVAAYVFKEWNTGDWATLTKPGGLEAHIKKLLGPSALSRNQTVGQRQPELNDHCRGDKLDLMGWFTIESARLLEIRGKCGSQ